jgi:hypothetical protein
VKHTFFYQKTHRIDILTVVTLKAQGAVEAKSGALTAVFGGHAPGRLFTEEFLSLAWRQSR